MLFFTSALKSHIEISIGLLISIDVLLIGLVTIRLPVVFLFDKYCVDNTVLTNAVLAKNLVLINSCVSNLAVEGTFMSLDNDTEFGDSLSIIRY